MNNLYRKLQDLIFELELKFGKNNVDYTWLLKDDTLLIKLKHHRGRVYSVDLKDIQDIIKKYGFITTSWEITTEKGSVVLDLSVFVGGGKND